MIKLKHLLLQDQNNKQFSLYDNILKNDKKLYQKVQNIIIINVQPFYDYSCGGILPYILNLLIYSRGRIIYFYDKIDTPQDILDYINIQYNLSNLVNQHIVIDNYVINSIDSLNKRLKQRITFMEWQDMGVKQLEKYGQGTIRLWAKQRLFYWQHIIADYRKSIFDTHINFKPNFFNKYFNKKYKPYKVEEQQFLLCARQEMVVTLDILRSSDLMIVGGDNNNIILIKILLQLLHKYPIIKSNYIYLR